MISCEDTVREATKNRRLREQQKQEKEKPVNIANPDLVQVETGGNIFFIDLQDIVKYLHFHFNLDLIITIEFLQKNISINVKCLDINSNATPVNSRESRSQRKKKKPAPQPPSRIVTRL